MRSAVAIPIIAVAALGFVWTAARSAPAEPLGALATGTEAHPAPYTGHGLCGTEDIIPTALFSGEYTDQVGHHYHGWMPPAGPPFFELCLLPPNALDQNARR